MRRILTDLTTTLSEFRKNPNQIVKNANDKPFAVLTNNKPSFYVLTPNEYDALLERIWELEITPTILERIEQAKDPSNRIRVTSEDLLK